jgi:secreted trypsin-like serine protease
MRKVTAIFVFLVTFLTSTEATTEGELAKEDPLFRSLQKRIVGGTQAALGEFPFFVDWGGQCESV